MDPIDAPASPSHCSSTAVESHPNPATAMEHPTRDSRQSETETPLSENDIIQPPVLSPIPVLAYPKPSALCLETSPMPPADMPLFPTHSTVDAYQDEFSSALSYLTTLPDNVSSSGGYTGAPLPDFPFYGMPTVASSSTHRLRAHPYAQWQAATGGYSPSTRPSLSLAPTPAPSRSASQNSLGHSVGQSVDLQHPPTNVLEYLRERAPTSYRYIPGFEPQNPESSQWENQGGDATQDAPPSPPSKAAATTPKKKSKDHPCHICGHIFPRPSGLRTHLNSHNNIRPFPCIFPGCGKTFTVRSNAKRHLRTHGIKDTSQIRIPDLSMGQHWDYYDSSPSSSPERYQTRTWSPGTAVSDLADCANLYKLPESEPPSSDYATSDVGDASDRSPLQPATFLMAVNNGLLEEAQPPEPQTEPSIWPVSSARDPTS